MVNTDLRGGRLLSVDSETGQVSSPFNTIGYKVKRNVITLRKCTNTSSLPECRHVCRGSSSQIRLWGCLSAHLSPLRRHPQKCGEGNLLSHVTPQASTVIVLPNSRDSYLCWPSWILRLSSRPPRVLPVRASLVDVSSSSSWAEQWRRPRSRCLGLPGSSSYWCVVQHC